MLGLESISFAQSWQSQMQLSFPLRVSASAFSSYRGPPEDAAVMCAPTPTLMTPLCSAFEPMVSRWQSGFEHR